MNLDLSPPFLPGRILVHKRHRFPNLQYSEKVTINVRVTV